MDKSTPELSNEAYEQQSAEFQKTLRLRQGVRAQLIDLARATSIGANSAIREKIESAIDQVEGVEAIEDAVSALNTLYIEVKAEADSNPLHKDLIMQGVGFKILELMSKAKLEELADKTVVRY